MNKGAIGLNKELVEKMKREVIYLIVLFVLGIVMFKAVFFRESFFVVGRTVFAFFWLFVLPGFYLLYYWHEKLDFMARFIAGIAVSMAVIGVVSYYLGLIGFNIKFHGVLLPVLFLLADFFVLLKK